MTEMFRRLVIKCFQQKKLITERFAWNLLSWKNSGFSVDNSIRIYGNDHKAREALSQYIAKPPVSLEKIHYEPFHGKVLYKTPKYNEYFGENFKFFDALDLIAELTAHIPPKGKQYIRRYGLYSSRTRGVWQRMEFCVRLAPRGWKEKHLDNPADAERTAAEKPECGVEKKAEKSTWARLIKKVYGTDPLVCPACGSEMRILAVIVDPRQTEKILATKGCLAPGQQRQASSQFQFTLSELISAPHVQYPRENYTFSAGDMWDRRAIQNRFHPQEQRKPSLGVRSIPRARLLGALKDDSLLYHPVFSSNCSR